MDCCWLNNVSLYNGLHRPDEDFTACSGGALLSKGHESQCAMSRRENVQQHGQTREEM